MQIKYEDYLIHTGIKGMKWGRRKLEGNSGNGNNKKTAIKISSNSKKSVKEKNAEILKKNPHAAVVNYAQIKKSSLSEEEISVRNKKIRNIAIGVGLGLTITAGTILYLKNKKAVDGAVGDFFQKFGKKKLNEFPDSSKLSKVEITAFKKLGVKNIETKQNAVTTNLVASWVGHDKTRYADITDEAYEALDDVDISLKPGQVIKRITTNAAEKLRDNAFVSFEEDDSNRYTAFLPAMWKVNGGLKEKPTAYSMAMEAVSEIKSPSAKKRIEILSDIIKNDPVAKMALIGLEDSTITPLDLAKRRYNSVVTNLVDRDSYITKKYFEAVKRLGYNALVDDNDAGRLTKAPLILLDSTTVITKGITKLTKSTIDEALGKIQPMIGESFNRTYSVLNEKQSVGDKLMSGDTMSTFRSYYAALNN